MMKRTQGGSLGLLCAVVYFASYLTRHNFSAVMAEIIATGTEAKVAAMVPTVGFISYGAFQLVSGFLGDRISPKRMITGGLLVTALMNFLLPLCRTGLQMCLIWTVNGAAQSMIWPPIVKLLSVLRQEEYNSGCVKVTTGGAVGTVAIYCLAPVVLMISDWRAVFYVCGGIALAITLLWILRIDRVIVEPTKSDEPTEPTAQKAEATGRKFPLAYLPMTLFGILAIITQGMLRDGITTWTPVYLTQVYHLEAGLSILITVALPILTVIGVKLTAVIHNRVFDNELSCAAAIFAVASVGSLLLVLFPQLPAGGFAAVAAILAACAHGINMMLVSVFPLRYQRLGRISFMAGLLNAFAYVGSSLSGIGFERISAAFGWSRLILVWFVLCLIGTGLCCLLSKIKQ